MKRKIFSFALFMLVFSSISINSSIINSNFDLKEANVTNVSVTLVSENNYNFDVTLIHDDDGEDGYADLWQVESLNGTLLGKRILIHPHGTIEFTRSQVIPVIKINLVVIRGYDQTHGFGGLVIIYNMETEYKDSIDQGSERMDFSNYSQDSSSTFESSPSNDTNINSVNLDFQLINPIFVFIIPVVVLIRKKK